MVEALDGVPQCRMSIFKYGNVTCHSLSLIVPNVPCQIKGKSVSHVTMTFVTSMLRLMNYHFFIFFIFY